MSSFEKMLKRHLFDAGKFFQINWDNPIYLDKTGEAMMVTREILQSWSGGINGFNFTDLNNIISGSMSIEKLWIKSNSQEYYDNKKDNQFQKLVIDIFTKFNDTFKINKINRIGFRTQNIFGRIDEKAFSKFKTLLHNNVINELGTSININNQTLHIYGNDKTDNNKNINIQVSFVSKQKGDGPEKGFLIDIDIYQSYDLSKKYNVNEEIDQLFLFINKNGLNFITSFLNILELSSI